MFLLQIYQGNQIPLNIGPFNTVQEADSWAKKAGLIERKVSYSIEILRDPNLFIN